MGVFSSRWRLAGRRKESSKGDESSTLLLSSHRAGSPYIAKSYLKNAFNERHPGTQAFKFGK